MAVEPLKPSPVKLDPQAAQKLRDLGPDLERAWKEIEIMKKLGMNTDELEATLLKAQQSREIILANFV